MTAAQKTLPASHPFARMVARAVAAAIIATALSPVFALGVGPSPQLSARMQQDAALAKRINAGLASAKARGIDGGVAMTRGPLPRRIVQATPGTSSVGLAPAGAPIRALQSPGATATVKMLVLLVDFPDKTNLVSTSFFDNLMFGDVVGPTSVRGYYREVSAGQLDIVPVATDLPSTVGWIMMPHPESYYVSGGDHGMGTYPGNGQKLFEDACAAAEAAGVDFSKYDGDGDGYVDGVTIVHAGRGAEYTGSANDIWSHQWWANNDATYDGVKIGPYSTEPEYWNTPGDMTSGVFAHEFGHVFGLPDLYDTDYSSTGLGTWSLMSGGGWNGPNNEGGCPARFDAWSLEQLGFVKTVDATMAINAETIYAASSTAEGTVVRVERGAGTTGKQYFLIENRQKRGTDAYLPGSGLLIYHVDETQLTAINPSTGYPYNNDNETHYLVDIEEAHGGTQNLQASSSSRTSNDGDAGDSFPGAAGKRLFTDTTDPNARYYGGSASNIKIDSIGDNSATMTARVIPDVTWASTDFTAPTSTSDAVSSYLGTATITFSASDGVGGSGVRVIRWTLDGVSGTGSTLVVSGFGSHHLEFWAEDYAGHSETPHAVDFTVGDENPPVVTSDAAPSYSSAAVTVTLSASDGASGSGVASLSYQLDGGSIITTTAASATVAIAGTSAPHELVYWALDNQGNESAHVVDRVSLHDTTQIKLTSGSVTIWAGVTFWVRGHIDPLAPATPVSGQSLRLERWTGAAWVPVAYTALQSDYTFAFGVRPMANATYRVVAWSYLLPGASPTTVRAYVKAVLGTPSVPSAITRGYAFTTKGSVSPHALGTVTVRWYRYSSSGALYAYGTPKTVSVAASTGGWYVRRSLPAGRYAVRVTHSDPTHVYSSSGYRSFVVK